MAAVVAEGGGQASAGGASRTTQAPTCCRSTCFTHQGSGVDSAARRAMRSEVPVRRARAGACPVLLAADWATTLGSSAEPPPATRRTTAANSPMSETRSFSRWPAPSDLAQHAEALHHTGGRTVDPAYRRQRRCARSGLIQWRGALCVRRASPGLRTPDEVGPGWYPAQPHLVVSRCHATSVRMTIPKNTLEALWTAMPIHALR